MRIRTDPDIHLTYCLNIHPGESWDENFAAIRQKATVVRKKLKRRGPFGLGLRLSARAAEELCDGDRLAELARFLDKEKMYVFTINGFPYGQFHDTAVKESVYAPDWRDRRRREYTVLLADILAQLLPEGVSGSISTVPLSYKAWIADPAQLAPMIENLADVAGDLDEIRRRTGRDICVALEPEPDCCIETTAEAVAFFTGPLASGGVAHLQKAFVMDEPQARAALARHVGICLDTAHAAVEFEPLPAAARQLQAAGIRIAKVQLSSALSIRPGPETLDRLREFVDKVYLHQVKVRRADGTVASFADLPQALAGEVPAAMPPVTDRETVGPEDRETVGPGDRATAGGEEWRVHFHVPLFFAGHRGLESTSRLLAGEFAELLRAGLSPNVEIETYTFNVLPDFLRPSDITDCIVEEYRWVLQHVFG
jgi:sugar phosphate isomerase/epimerase